MADGFNRDEIKELMVKCHRRCCICHRFCGVKMEIDHINQKADGGSNEIENAIPVCFECHAEIHAYNNKHPKGRKFTPEEIKGHKEQWLNICQTRPEVFTEPLREYEIGPIAALIDELDFNYYASTNVYGSFTCQFRDEQFRKAISAGALSSLIDEVRRPIYKAYDQIGKANHSMDIYSKDPQSIYGNLLAHVREEIKKSSQLILEAKNVLTNFLRNED